MNSENRNGYEIYALGDSAITIEFGKYIASPRSGLSAFHARKRKKYPHNGIRNKAGFIIFTLQ